MENQLLISACMAGCGKNVFWVFLCGSFGIRQNAFSSRHEDGGSYAYSQIRDDNRTGAHRAQAFAKGFYGICYNKPYFGRWDQLFFNEITILNSQFSIFNQKTAQKFGRFENLS